RVEKRFFDGVSQRAEERVVELRDQHADGLRFLPAEAARQRAWVIVQRSHRVFDPLLQVDTDVARLVDDARNRRHRNTSLIRYFPYGRHLPASLQCKSVTSTLASCQVMLTTRRSRENQRAGNCGYVNSWRANGQPV